MTDIQFLDSILAATSLGDLEGSAGKEAEAVYKKYARRVHPDMFQEQEAKDKAQDAFTHLTKLKDKAEGKEDPSLTPAKARVEKNTVRGTNAYELKRIFSEDGTFTTHYATYNKADAALVSVLGDAVNTDLADAQVSALKSFDALPREIRIGYPVLLEDFTYREEPSGVERRAIATRAADGFRPLSQFIEERPHGRPLRDVIWIFRAMLSAVHHAHKNGLVNGAPTLDAFLIHEGRQALILADWAYSVPVGGVLSAVPQRWEQFYPDYALEGQTVDDRLDIGIVAAMLELMLTKFQPQEVFDFIDYCKSDEVAEVPQVLVDFDAVVDRVFNPPVVPVQPSFVQPPRPQTKTGGGLFGRFLDKIG